MNAQPALADREISAERTFNAPLDLVWRAWADHEHLEQWWGPLGFTTTTKEFDFRTGGVWNHTMHGPDGTDYRNEITFTLIDQPNRIEYDHGPSPLFHVSVEFAADGPSKTNMSWKMLFATKQERDRTAEKFGAIEGLAQTIGRLEEFLTAGK